MFDLDVEITESGKQLEHLASESGWLSMFE